MKILVVCSGNICRSPMAEAILRRSLQEAGAVEVDVSSAGTLGIENEPAHTHAVATAADEGIDLSAHRSRPLTREMAGGADLVLGMEPVHLDAVRRLVPDHANVRLMTAFLSAEGAEGAADEIDDPLAGEEDAFRECFRMLERCAGGVVEALLAGRVRARTAPEKPKRTHRKSTAWSQPESGMGRQEEANGETAYFEAIGERVAGARGGVAGLTSMEFHIVDGWCRRSVPLWLALDAIAETAALWPPGEAPRTFLKHCEKTLAHRLEETGAALPASPSGGGSGGETPAADAARRRAGDLLREALGRVSQGHEPLRAALADSLDDLSRAPSNLAAMEAALAGIRRRLVAAASSVISADRVAAIHDEASRRLQGVAGTMSPQAYQDTLARLAGDGILETVSLPALSLLDLLPPADPSS